MPDWYPVLRVAEAWHVAPWELAQRPEWVDLFFAVRDAEQRAADYKATKAEG